jgi:hypothetical protein
MRMATPYAGSSQGMNLLLHKRAEVLLAFAGGDPDTPVIENAAPNSENPSVANQTNSTCNRQKLAGDTADEKQGNYWDLIHGNEEKIVWGQSAYLHPGSRFMGCLGVNTNLCLGFETNIHASPLLNTHLFPTLTYQGSDAITQGSGSAYTINKKTETVSTDEILLVGGVTGAYRLATESRWKKAAIAAASLVATGASLIPPVVSHFNPAAQEIINPIGLGVSGATGLAGLLYSVLAVKSSYIGPRDSLNIEAMNDWPDTPNEQAGGILRLSQAGVRIIGNRYHDDCSRPQILVQNDHVFLMVNRKNDPVDGGFGKSAVIKMDNSGVMISAKNEPPGNLPIIGNLILGSRHLAVTQGRNQFLVCREGIYLFTNGPRVNYQTQGVERIIAATLNYLFIDEQEVISKSTGLRLGAGNYAQIKTTAADNEIMMAGQGIQITSEHEVLMRGGRQVNLHADGYIHLG